MSDAGTELLEQQIAAYIGHQRWFAGKGREHEVTGLRTLAWLDGDDVRVQLALVAVTSAAGVDTYQLPLSHRVEWAEGLEHALVGTVDGVHVYDALHDSPAVEQITLALTTDVAVPAPLSAHRVAARDLELGQASVLLTGEQSNSNVRVGDDLLLKLFRRVTPGRNPDIEVLEALTTCGSHEIVPLVGWLAGAEDAGELDLAMLSDYLRTASDGWDLALTSVRDLFAERDLHPDEVGGDFASESHRLGITAARLHADLAAALPHETWDHDRLSQVTARMRARLDVAAKEVPEVAEHAPALTGAFDAMDGLTEGVAVQRVHGDFHLGQTLRTMDGWRVIDFEGEPATSLAERTALDSPMRDVAGMLRSFDYAAQSQWADLLGDHQLAQRAREWAERNRAAFVAGYAEDSGTDPAGSSAAAVLLRAYETDKAVYEAVYEARNRPTWLPIPLRAVSRLAHDTGGAS
ncbi:phosphotransferase [soil metagenome]